MGRDSENSSFQMYLTFRSGKNCRSVSRLSLKDSELAKGIGPDPTALSKLHVPGGMWTLTGHGWKQPGFEGLECWRGRGWNAGFEGENVRLWGWDTGIQDMECWMLSGRNVGIGDAECWDGGNERRI